MENDFDRAQKMVFRYLSYRDRSVKEIRDYLSRKQFSQELSDEIVAYLLEHKFLDDKSFAYNWVEYKKQCGRGPRKISFELYKKGIDKSLIEAAIEEQFKADDVDEIIQDLIVRKRRSLKKGIKPFEQKQKIYAFLASRGYNFDEIKRNLDVSVEY